MLELYEVIETLGFVFQIVILIVGIDSQFDRT